MVTEVRVVVTFVEALMREVPGSLLRCYKCSISWPAGSYMGVYICKNFNKLYLGGMYHRYKVGTRRKDSTTGCFYQPQWPVKGSRYAQT